MKFGISSYVWVSPFSDEKVNQFAHAKKMGFDIYEIGVEETGCITPSFIKEEADKAGISVHICGAFGESRDISSENEEFRINGVNYIKSLIDMAVIVHSPYVAGPMYAATGKARLASKEEKKIQYSFGVENMLHLARYAKERNIKLALEPLNRFETDFMNTVEQGNKFIDDIGMDNVGFLLDTFHMNIEETNIRKAIMDSGDRLYDFHACSNNRGTPGEDHLNWKEIKEALQAIQYDGSIVIESFTTDIKEIAKAVSLWRPLANSQDELAKNGLIFLQKQFKEEGKV